MDVQVLLKDASHLSHHASAASLPLATVATSRTTAVTALPRPSSSLDSPATILPHPRIASPSPLVPTLLATYTSPSSLSLPRTYYNPFFNEPYMRHRDTPPSTPALTASNRAIPHAFPSPLPLSPLVFSASLTIGVLCYDVERIAVLLDTWGRFAVASHLLIFSERQASPDAERRQLAMPQVIVMDNAANEGRNVTERRASAWKVLPAVRVMYDRQPESEWFYLCDDDSFPVIPVLAAYVASFYQQGGHNREQPLYVGQSVGQAMKARSYYADEAAQDVNLRYHCTGGGVLLNLQLVSRMQPYLAGCFASYASDLTLGLCIQQHVADVVMVDVEAPHYLYAQTMEQAVKKFGLEEDGVWEAGAFHHMREPFISQHGVDDRLEGYLRESEMRTYAGYLWATHQLRATQGRGEGGEVRVLLVGKGQAGKEAKSVAELALELMKEDGRQPLALLTELGLDTDVLLVERVDRKECGVCDLYGDAERRRCIDLYSHSPARLYHHVQRSSPSPNPSTSTTPLSSTPIRFSSVSYAPYQLVLSMDALISPGTVGAALFAFFSHPRCSFHFSSPPPPFDYALHDRLSLLDALHTDESARQTFLLPFPSLSLFYGAYHALGLTPQPHLHTRRDRLLLYIHHLPPSPAYLPLASALSLTCKRIIPPPAAALVGPHRPLPLADLSRARLCLFPFALTPSAANVTLTAEQRAGVVRLLLSAVAAGCYVIASEEVGSWGLRGERVERVEEGGSVAVVLGEHSLVRSEEEMLAAISRSEDERVYGVGAAYERAALNAHLLEKPWHLLMTALQRHREGQRITA